MIDEIQLKLKKKNIFWFTKRMMLFVIILLALVGFYRSLNTYIKQDFPIAHDLACYYVAAYAIAQGYSPYNMHDMDVAARDLNIEVYGEYVYPPFWGSFLQPIHHLSQNQLKAVWLFVNLFFLFFSIRMIRNILNINHKSVILLLISLLFPPIYATIIGGNVNIIILFFLILCIFFANKKKNIYSGFALGLAIGIKIYPIVFLLLFIFYKRYIIIIVSLVTTFLTFIFGFIVRGNIDTTIYWFNDVLFSIPSKLISYVDLSTSAVVYRFFTGRTYTTYDGDNPVSSYIPAVIEQPSFVRPWSYVIILSVFIITMFYIIRCRHNKNSIIYTYILFISMTLLIIPRVWDHYYVLAVPSIIFLLFSASNKNRKYLYLGIFFIILQRFSTKLLLIFASPFMTYFGYIGGILLWVVMLFEYKSYIISEKISSEAN